MKCPICGTAAKDITADGDKGVSFRCPVDGDCDIADGCQKALRAPENGDRHRVLNKSIISAWPGSRACISTTTITNVKLRDYRLLN
jgi:hypothetical protein